MTERKQLAQSLINSKLEKNTLNELPKVRWPNRLS
jgi:hypothetical protein